MLLAAETVLNSRLQLLAIIVTAGLLLLVFELVRQRRLMERYSLLWLLAALVLLLLAIFSGLLGGLSDTVGIATPSNALFAVALGFVMVMLLHFSATISKMTDEIKILAQKLAASEERLRRVEASGEHVPPPDAPTEIPATEGEAETAGSRTSAID